MTNSDCKAAPSQWTGMLMTLQGAGYLVQLLHEGSVTGPTVDAMFGAGNASHLTLSTQPWRLITSLFMHAGWLHLLMNMAFLVVVGPRVEAVFGARAYLLLFLAGGCLAGLGSAVWGVGHAARTNLLGQVRYDVIVSVGMSGALMAICGALLMAKVLGDEDQDPWLQQPEFTKSLWLPVALTLAYGFINSASDQAAHVIGLAGGAVLGVCLFTGLRSGSPLRRRASWAFSLVAPPLLVSLFVPLPAAQDLRVMIEEAARYEAYEQQSQGITPTDTQVLRDMFTKAMQERAP